MKTMILILLSLFSATATADLRSIVHNEGLDPKIEPHFRLLDDFPVTVIVEFQGDGPASDPDLKHIYHSMYSPIIEIAVKNPGAMLKLLRDPNVVSIRPNDDLSISMIEVKKDVKFAEHRAAYPTMRGAGVTVAVIDTGIRKYDTGCSGPTSTKTALYYSTVASVNFGPAVVYSCWMSDDQHGTIVGEIIHDIAPDAKLISLRIGGDVTGLTVANLAKAVDWIVANRVTYNIVAANVSLGAHTSFPSDCYTSLGNLMRTLSEAGVVPVVATGNDSFKGGLAEPSCSPFAIAVGGEFDALSGSSKNIMLPFANVGPAIDIIAPGCTTTTVTSNKKSLNPAAVMNCGTSLASPVIVGVIAALTGTGGKNPGQTAIRNALINGSTVQVTDPWIPGTSYPLIDMLGAAQKILGGRTGIPPINCAPSCIQ
jgi:hypothetical protein